jgi:hypothetical protein
VSHDRRDGLIALLVFAVALWVNLAAVRTTEFHRDEARWIHRARFAAELSDPTGPYWQSRELMWGQPPFGSYLTGWGLLAQGRDTFTNDLYNFRYGEAWNRRHGAMPEERDLLAARRTNSVVGAAIAVCVYLIARGLGGRVAGVAAALMLIPHPLSVYLSSLAGSDAPLVLSLSLATVVAMSLADRPTWPKAIALGLLLGIGGSIKLSPLPMTAAFVGFGLVLLWRAWRSAGSDRTWARGAAIGWKLLPLPAIAFATFVLSYPYLWPDPIGRTLVLFRFRAKEMFNQGQFWPELSVNGPVDAPRSDRQLPGRDGLNDRPDRLAPRLVRRHRLAPGRHRYAAGPGRGAPPRRLGDPSRADQPAGDGGAGAGVAGRARRRRHAGRLRPLPAAGPDGPGDLHRSRDQLWLGPASVRARPATQRAGRRARDRRGVPGVGNPGRGSPGVSRGRVTVRPESPVDDHPSPTSRKAGMQHSAGPTGALVAATKRPAASRSAGCTNSRRIVVVPTGEP